MIILIIITLCTLVILLVENIYLKKRIDLLAKSLIDTMNYVDAIYEQYKHFVVKVNEFASKIITSEEAKGGERIIIVEDPKNKPN